VQDPLEQAVVAPLAVDVEVARGHPELLEAALGEHPLRGEVVHHRPRLHPVQVQLVPGQLADPRHGGRGETAARVLDVDPVAERPAAERPERDAVQVERADRAVLLVGEHPGHRPSRVTVREQRGQPLPLPLLGVEGVGPHGLPGLHVRAAAGQCDGEGGGVVRGDGTESYFLVEPVDVMVHPRTLSRHGARPGDPVGTTLSGTGFLVTALKPAGEPGRAPDGAVVRNRRGKLGGRQ